MKIKRDNNNQYYIDNKIKNKILKQGNLKGKFSKTINIKPKATTFVKIPIEINVNNIGKIKEGIIIIGNESKGISVEVMAMADEKITIPKLGEAESLNAAVAAGIILFAVT